MKSARRWHRGCFLSVKFLFVFLPLGFGVMSVSSSSPVLAAEALPPASPPAPPRVKRGGGPAGSVLLVEENPALPLVDVVVAFRQGAGEDPRYKDGLANLAAEAARRGAGARDRGAFEAALEALGATLDVEVTTDAVSFEGHVLARNLDAYLGLIADVLLRPRFEPAEVERARRDVLAGIDEQRTNDHALAARFFARNVFGDHPYGRPADGSGVTVARIGRGDLAAWLKSEVVGPNLIFAAAGPLDLARWADAVGQSFGAVPSGPLPAASPLPARRAYGPTGWRLQLVDKPERKQVQIMFGQPVMAPTNPDYVALEVALASFGGHAMTATLMNELRTERGLVYGAYADLVPGRHVSAIRAWTFTREEKAVQTLRLALRAFLKWAEGGLTAERLALTKTVLVGMRMALWDDPGQRLKARVKAEWQGRPPEDLDVWPSRVQALTVAEVNAVLRRSIKPKDLAITLVGTAGTLMKRLTAARIAGNAIDVFPYTVDDPKTAPGMSTTVTP